MRLIFKDKFDKAIDLSQAKSIRVYLPYRGDKTLETSANKTSDKGVAELVLGAFERKGLNEGKEQSFKADVNFSDKTLHFLFESQLDINTDAEGVKQLCISNKTETR